MTAITSVVSIGECMLELSHQDQTTLTMNFGGDTLNMAVYLRRLIDPNHFQVEYVTALGDDPYSDQMIAAWRKEGIGTEMVRRIPHKLPGLYLIKTDDHGERSFYFFRSQSAAREMFLGPEGRALCNKLIHFKHIYFSGIALAILSDEQRDLLHHVLVIARTTGAKIYFDTNFRSSLWPDTLLAKQIMERFLKLVDIALPSFGDEQSLFGDLVIEDTAKRIHGYGVEEVVVKDGARGYLLSKPEESEFIKIKANKEVVDTTGAGDSFNAAYLAARLQNHSMVKAASFAATLASVVIKHRGAIIPIEKTLKLS